MNIVRRSALTGMWRYTICLARRTHLVIGTSVWLIDLGGSGSRSAACGLGSDLVSVARSVCDASYTILGRKIKRYFALHIGGPSFLSLRSHELHPELEVSHAKAQDPVR